MKQTFVLAHDEARRRACQAIQNAPAMCVYCGADFQQQYEHQEYCSLRCFHGQRSMLSYSEDHVKEKLMRQVAKSDGCWDFLGLRTAKGYGRLFCRGRMCLAHRVAYEVFKGEIPDGLGVLHKCDNPPCTNPDHLFLGTNGDNNRDKATKGRSLRGESHLMSKLTEQQVMAIYADARPYAEIVADYGVSKSHISCIKSGKVWAHLNLTAQ
jgi:hypothetical protein